ncbi:hypothetical protein Sipo8835_43425 [Streptomyces ipomoeae]|uniref:Ricin B lectin domain-containing protein n=1 Tax=Streptomyces ipomoeae TaxID=103232 RepID=A0AAE8VTZ9_9ACTN|nr:RICIN domain-containing protein [Streptomyces ipomoeae]TQE16342.1 hypothetical protein Sipo8835_43425 [Streptomyces ipomoeae]TQE36684.1 hypothetical protein Sipo7851_11265 [Streptomyces ipomoeae]
MGRDEHPGDNAPYAEASDARLTALLRADTPIAYPALRELRARHRPSVLAYARQCTISETSAQRLAAEVFTAAARQTARGTEPSVPWRHQLLLLTARLAGIRAPEDPPPPMLPAFESLPPRDQGLIWYGIVEQEPDDRTALLLGLSPEDVSYKQEPALLALRKACLRLRLAASDDPRCQDFRRLIEESVRPDNPRHSTDLRAHMAHCAHCTGAYDELRALRDRPRAALAEGLLPWAGTAYARAGTSEPRGRTESGATAQAAVATVESWTDAEESAGAGTGEDSGAEAGAEAGTSRWTAGTETRAWTGTGAGTWTGTGAEAGTGTGAGAGPGAEAWVGPGTGAGARASAGSAAGAGAVPEGRPASRRLVLTSVALGVALAPLLVVLVFSGGGGSSSQDAADSVGTPTSPPTARETPTAPSSPAPSATASSTQRPSKPPKSPSPTKKPKPTKTPSPSRTAPSLPSAPLPNGSYAQVVNVGSGLCLDIRGALEKGTDVVTATCSSRDTQRWRYDSDLDALQSFADPHLCLDSRGATDDGVGIWECDSLDGDNGENLRFTIDSQGLIRPAIAPDHAVTPAAHGSVAFAEATGRDEQRWRAGAGARRR